MGDERPVPASDELFEDAPAIVTYIDNELVRMALQKEERAIAEGLHTASTTWTAGGLVSASPSDFDGVLEGR